MVFNDILTQIFESEIFSSEGYLGHQMHVGSVVHKDLHAIPEKKSGGDKSADLVCQATGTPRPIHLF